MAFDLRLLDLDVDLDVGDLAGVDLFLGDAAGLGGPETNKSVAGGYQNLAAVGIATPES